MDKQKNRKISRCKKKLLLHTCCSCCATEVYNRLKNDYDVTLFWYNPNIEPFGEYKNRLESFDKLADDLNAKKITVEYYQAENKKWHEFIKGLENEPEGGKRCERCYRFRLKATAQYAHDNNFDIFATTLTISPHKNAELINYIGSEIASTTCHAELVSASHEIPKRVRDDKKKIKFLESNFKKQDGFKKSIELSHKHNLYRQHYCGCKFSHKN